MEKNNDVKSMLKDAGILFVITLLAGLMLGFVYEITKEPIAQQEQKASKKHTSSATRKEPNSCAHATASDMS